MKTTIDIADELIQQAKRIQKREDITLRALVEDGLRMAIEKHATLAIPYKWEPVVVGEPGAPVPDMAELLAAANERPWIAREFARLQRVAEPDSLVWPASKPGRTHKKAKT